MDLLELAHPTDPARDMALTGALLGAVADGSSPEVIRVFRPGPTLAFGRLDRLRPGFPDACRIAAGAGWTPVLRWGGGHAVAYDRDCVLLEIIRRRPPGAIELDPRFVEATRLVTDALAPLGVALELGERPGEYCAGRFSLHLPGGGKVAGVAQRVVRGATLTTAAIIVAGGQPARPVLQDVYAALAVPMDPRTVGCLTDAHPGLSAETVRRALIVTAGVRLDARPAEASLTTPRGG